MAAVTIQISKADIMQMNKSFAMLSDSLKRNVERKILTAVSTEQKKAYRRLTPRSSQTGTYEDWSASTAARRQGGVDKLKKAITHKPSSKWKNAAQLRKRGILGVTAGYDYSRGSEKAAPYAHLVNDGHVAVYWGRHGGGRVAGIHWQKEARAQANDATKRIVEAKARKAVTAAVIMAAKKGNR